jgi:hypothetical protein
MAVILGIVCSAVMGQQTNQGGRIAFDGQPIVYEVVEGMAVIEGDIILGPVEEVERKAKQGGRRDGNFFPSTGRFRWPNGVIPYVINPDVVNPQRVLDAIGIWNETGIVRFIPRTNETACVRVRHQVGGVCSAFGGMVGGEQFVNLPAFCDLRDTVHEFGHTIGFSHENMRPDRDSWIGLRHDEMTAAARTGFDVPRVPQTPAGPYDYQSIMHYGKLQAARNGRPVVETIPIGIPMDLTIRNPFRSEAVLSVPLLEALKRDYGLAKDVVITTNPPGLQFVADGSEYTSPQRFDWVEGSVHRVEVPGVQLLPEEEGTRYSFARWSDGGERSHQITVPRDGGVWIANFVRQIRLRKGVTPEGSGTVRANPVSEDGWYAEGSRVELTAVAGEGYSFESWPGRTDLAQSRQGQATNPAVAFLFDPAADYTARFQRDFVTTITTDPPGLVVRVDNVVRFTPYRTDFEPGSTHTLNAGPQTGPLGVTRYVFEGWTDGAPATRTITHEGPSKTYTAKYRVEHQLSLNLNPGVTITTTPPSESGYYPEDAEVELRASIAGDFPFRTWTWDLSGNENPKRIVMNRDKLVGAWFGSQPAPPVLSSPTPVEITVDAGGELTRLTYPITSGEVGVDFSVESESPWLSVEADRLTTPAILSLIADPGGLALGAHAGAIRITAPGTENSPRVVPVRLLVR